MLQYENYITESKLKNIIKSITKDDYIGEELKLENYRYKFDLGYIKDGIKFLVEFDGDLHYRDNNVIRRDDIKNELAHKFGYTLIRFPYWLQLTTQTLKLFFNLDNEINQNYSHGFIDKACMLPSSYCELGLFKFLDLYNCLPYNIQEDIKTSLINKIEIYKEEKYVIPTMLKYILN